MIHLKFNARLFSRIFLGPLLLTTGSGCITGSIITLGTVLGALGSAASTGSDVYKLGKLDAVLDASASDCHLAAVQTAKELGLMITIDEHSDPPEDVFEMTMHDDQKSPVGVHIERRTAVVCRVRIDVGFFGSEPTTKLFMQHLRANLHLAAPAQTP